MPPVPGMNDFTRPIWSSKAGPWKDKFKAVSRAWQVFETTRPAYITTIKSEDLKTFYNHLNKQGKDLVVLDPVNEGDTYSNNVGDLNVSKPILWRILVGNNIKGIDLNDSNIGKILGYPECCINFFNSQWVDNKNIDYTYNSFMNNKRGDKVFEECNIFLRYLGIRPIFHLPCSLDCFETQILAHRNVQEFAKQYPEEAKILKEILGWPLFWSSINGVAEIRFPLGKIIARTDYYPDRKEIKVDGRTYPIEGESGVVWPYTEKGRLLVKSGYTTKNTAGEKEINGFQTFESQLSGHVWLSSELSRFTTKGSFIDLGAGNGDLIRYLEKVYPEMSGYGVDSEFTGYKTVTMNLRDVKFHPDGNPKAPLDFALIAEQRFYDTYSSEKEALVHIFTFVKAVFVYNYFTRQVRWLHSNVNQE